MFFMRYCTVVPAVAFGLIASVSAFASDLVYHPVNPTFGGSPLNGSSLLSQAQSQGEGVKSGPQGPDLSGLNNALGNLGNGGVIIGGAGGNGTAPGGPTSNAAKVP
jgi:curli production assembly/transport component CsgF